MKDAKVETKVKMGTLKCTCVPYMPAGMHVISGMWGKRADASFLKDHTD